MLWKTTGLAVLCSIASLSFAENLITLAPVAIAINTRQDLQNMANNLNGHYVLNKDINMQGIAFTPVGSTKAPFTGMFNGNGHTIENLNIQTGELYDAGLFGSIGTKGVIANLNINQAEVTGRYNVGILSGENAGLIQNSTVIGKVSGYSNVGGLVGANNAGEVNYCKASANVYPQNDFAGILVGGNTGLIQYSQASGEVVAPNSNHVGGLTGDNGEGGSILNSDATGFVAGEDNVGGLSGGNYTGFFQNDFANVTVNATGEFVGGLSGDNVGNQAVIENSYSLGKVSAQSDNVGGLVGYSEGKVQNSYWDLDTSGQIYSAGGIGESDAKLHEQTTYQNWDFKTVWQMQAYPELRVIR